MKYGTNLDRTDLSTLDWIQQCSRRINGWDFILRKLKHQFAKEKERVEKNEEIGF